MHTSLIKVEKLSTISEPPMVWGLFLDNVSLTAHLTEFASDGIVGSIKNINKDSGKKILESAIANLIKFINDFRNF